MHEQYGVFGMAGVGFFGMLFIGFLAGWIAERVMNRDHGLLTNVLVGIAGSFVGGTLAGILGFMWYGFIGNLVVATLGAILILWFFGRSESARMERQANRAGPGSGPKSWPVDREAETPIYHSKDKE